MEIIGEKAATSQLSSTTACSKFCLAYLKVHRLLTRKRHIKKSQNTRALPTQTFFTIPHFESNEDKSTSAHLKFQINKCSLFIEDTVKRQLRNAVFNKFFNNYYTLNSGPFDPSKARSGSQGDCRLTYQATTKAQEEKKHCDFKNHILKFQIYVVSQKSHQ